MMLRCSRLLLLRAAKLLHLRHAKSRRKKIVTLSCQVVDRNYRQGMTIVVINRF
jgi:hypothetical protein